MKIGFSRSREKNLSHFSSRIYRDRDSCQCLEGRSVEKKLIFRVKMIQKTSFLKSPGFFFNQICPFLYQMACISPLNNSGVVKIVIFEITLLPAYSSYMAVV